MEDMDDVEIYKDALFIQLGHVIGKYSVLEVTFSETIIYIKLAFSTALIHLSSLFCVVRQYYNLSFDILARILILTMAAEL